MYKRVTRSLQAAAEKIVPDKWADIYAEVSRFNNSAISMTNNQAAEKPHNLSRNGLVACLAAVFAIVVIILSINPAIANMPENVSNTHDFSNTGLQANSDAEDEQSYETHTTNPAKISIPPERGDGIKITINEITEQPNIGTMYFALLGEDFKEFTIDEMFEYYGISFDISSVLPSFSLTCGETPHYKARYGIYDAVDRGGGIVYDQNILFYTNDYYTNKLESANQKLKITLSLNRLPYAFYNEAIHHPLKTSIVNETEVTVTHYMGLPDYTPFELIDVIQPVDCLYAQFIYKNVGFFVSAENTSEEEFTKVIDYLTTR